MSLPLNPTNGQTAVFNNITYQYSTATNAWTRLQTTLYYPTIALTSTASSVSSSTGALQVAGGVGIGGNLFVGGTITANQLSVLYTTITQTTVYSPDIFTVTNTTVSVGTNSGALTVTGGVGIGGSLYAGNVYTNGAQILPTTVQEFTASAGQTLFTMAGGYVPGQILVYANGVLLSSSDYNATTSPAILLNTARNAGDIIKVVASQNFAQPISNVAAAAALAIAFGI